MKPASAARTVDLDGVAFTPFGEHEHVIEAYRVTVADGRKCFFLVNGKPPYCFDRLRGRWDLTEVDMDGKWNAHYAIVSDEGKEGEVKLIGLLGFEHARDFALSEAKKLRPVSIDKIYPKEEKA
jgi:hypothetical protein